MFTVSCDFLSTRLRCLHVQDSSLLPNRQRDSSGDSVTNIITTKSLSSPPSLFYPKKSIQGFSLFSKAMPNRPLNAFGHGFYPLAKLGSLFIPHLSHARWIKEQETY